MSTCISRHGEFSSHELDDAYTCTLCGALDEDALTAELHRLRQESADFRAGVTALRDALNDGGRVGIEDATDALLALIEGK